MTKRSHNTIKALVFDFIHQHEGKVYYEDLEAAVLKHFPDSAFKKTHWTWYRYQCTKKRFADQFSEAEKTALRSTMRHSRQRGPQERGDLGAVPITRQMLKATRRVVEAAKAYERAMGGPRKMGITGEAGKILVCHHLGLRLCLDPRSEDFDAIDDDGSRVQIKTRRSESDWLPRNAGRVSTFSKHVFDYVILAVLDRDYELAELWRADYREIIPLIEKQKRRNPGLAAFKRIAKRVWP